MNQVFRNDRVQEILWCIFRISGFNGAGEYEVINVRKL